jgi:hypothetical protein
VDFRPSLYNRISDDNYISPSMKTLHTVSAVIELGAGLALLVFPSAVVNLLLGSPLDAPAAVALGRLTGAALLALGVACWLARGDTPGCAARGLVVAMLVYNIGAVVVLGVAGVQLPTTGIALWPAVILHAVMAAWCGRELIGRKG